ncbi:MAG: nitroreductase, partial [Moheibacter sp.]
MKPEELLNIIKNRRSVMPIQYCNAEISGTELEMILESANWAPTHKRTEPVRFKIISGEGLNRFSEFMLNQYEKNTPAEKFSQRKSDGIAEKCRRSNKIILICVKYSGLVPEWEETASAATAVQNMWLMCTAFGIGSYWSTPGAIHNMKEFTELDENEKCIGVFYMGKISEGKATESQRE